MSTVTELIRVRLTDESDPALRPGRWVVEMWSCVTERYIVYSSHTAEADATAAKRELLTF